MISDIEQQIKDLYEKEYPPAAPDKAVVVERVFPDGRRVEMRRSELERRS